MQFMSERSSGNDESNVLEFMPGQDESFHMRQKLLYPERKSSYNQLNLHENFIYNVAVMGETRSENTAFIQSLLKVRISLTK